MVKTIWLGTFSVTLLLLIITCVNYLFIQDPNTPSRLLFELLTLMYLIAVLTTFWKRLYVLASWLLVALYTSIAILILLIWSIHASIGILMLGFVILLSGAMLGLRSIIPITIAVGGIVVILHILEVLNVYQTPRPDQLSDSGMAEVATYVTMFGIFALIARLSGKHLENNLKRALKAEAELEKEKAQLAVKLEEKTRALRKTQQEEIMQLYQFAELGQLTTVILHDLANNLSVLSLDIDDLTEENEASEAIGRTKESISYLEGIVTKVRRQISRTKQAEKFNALAVVRQTVTDFSTKSTRVGISININKKKSFRTFLVVGDPLRLSQILTILLNNAIDASIPEGMLKEVTIQLGHDDRHLTISVIDYGVGVPTAIRDSLFEPLQSTKQHGLGVGLFVAKQIADTHFKGSLSLANTTDRTEFVIRLPGA